MDARLNIITLGVKDLRLSRKFYEDGLGFKASKASNEKISFYQLGPIVLALFAKEDLAEDAHVSAKSSGFAGFTMAQNVRNKDEVALTLAKAEAVGGKLVKPAQDVFWGGHSGYFSDPDGFLWEIAWNPFFEIDSQGSLKLP